MRRARFRSRLWYVCLALCQVYLPDRRHVHLLFCDSSTYTGRHGARTQSRWTGELSVPSERRAEADPGEEVVYGADLGDLHGRCAAVRKYLY